MRVSGCRSRDWQRSTHLDNGARGPGAGLVLLIYGKIRPITEGLGGCLAMGHVIESVAFVDRVTV